jgi:hypothetical protein
MSDSDSASLLQLHNYYITNEPFFKTVIPLHTDIKNHRLGAFVYGFLSGLGLVLIIWGLASLIALPSRSSTMYIGLTMFGVLLFATGSCREAYLRGSLSLQPGTSDKNSMRTKPAPRPLRQPQTKATAHNQLTELDSLTTEQIREYPVGTQTNESDVYEQEQQMQS